MAKYMTKQRKALIGYFEKHVDEPVTAKQIADALADEGISLSAVYRNLSELEEENRVRRIISPDNRESVYQYSDRDVCRGCLHLSCKKCGKVTHMEQDDANALIKTLAKNDSFTVDSNDTVIYGICSDCKK